MNILNRHFQPGAPAKRARFKHACAETTKVLRYIGLMLSVGRAFSF